MIDMAEARWMLEHAERDEVFYSYAEEVLEAFVNLTATYSIAPVGAEDTGSVPALFSTYSNARTVADQREATTDTEWEVLVIYHTGTYEVPKTKGD